MVLLRSGLQTAFMLLAGVFLFGCEKESVIARVNGEAITQKDIKALVKHAGIKEGDKTQQAEMQKVLQQELLNQLINEKLVFQAARKEGIKVDGNEIAQAYNNIVRAFPKEEDYLKKLREKGLSKDTILKSLERDIITVKIRDSVSKNIAVSDKELLNYYNKNLKLLAVSEELRLSIIKTDNSEEVKKIKKELDSGANFEETAKKYPAGHTPPMGGETGWITLNTFPSDMAKEIRKIKTGAFGGPIKGREGYYFIKVQEKKEGKVPSFKEAKDGIKHVLMQRKKMERFNAWLQNEKKNAKIEMLQKT